VAPVTSDPGDRRAVVRLCLAALVAYASYALCRTPLLPLFAQGLGAGPSVVGIVVAASTLTGVLVKLPAGGLSDVFGRRPLLLAGAMVFALLPFSYLAVSTVGGLLLVRVLHGHATAIFGPVATATVSDLAPADRRGRWLGAYATAQAAGQTAAPVMAGYLLARGGFDVAFVVAGAIGLAVPVLIAWVPLEPTSDRPATGRRWIVFRDGVRAVMADRLVLVASAAHAVQFVLNGALTAFLPLYAKDALGLTTTEIGWLFAVQTLTVLATRPVVGALSDRAGRRVAITLGLAVSGVTVWTMSLADQGALLVASVVVYGVGVATTSAATSAYITDLTPRERYGAAHGVFGTIYDIGDALGPIGAGLIVSALGYEAMLHVAAVLGVTAALGFAVASSPSGRRDRQGVAAP
jgi:MFS transporter, DHA1 family, multidrug resistance protein